MPKILENIEEKIIVSARNQLFRDQKLSLRKLAGECEIGIGTIYNYFDSKESILNVIMLDDWKACLLNMDDNISSSENPKEACNNMLDLLEQFVNDYHNVFNYYANDAIYHSQRSTYHSVLHKNLTDRFKLIINKFNLDIDENLIPIFGELILMCAIGNDLNNQNFYSFIDLII